MNDEAFLAHVTDALAALPGVQAVTLGGSRGAGVARADSDWDFAIYYRDRFSPDDLRAVGWEGQVFGIGDWGGGVFNGGAWLTVDGRHVDVHYRDLSDVDRRIADARQGRFEIEHLLFHLAGVPTYIVLAELAINRVLHGQLPRPAYPDALRSAASKRWWSAAQLTLGYAGMAYALLGRVTQCAGGIATAACQTGHAVLAARGEWVTNEKALLDRAGLRGIDDVSAGIRADSLASACQDAEALLRRAAAAAGIEGDGPTEVG